MARSRSVSTGMPAWLKYAVIVALVGLTVVLALMALAKAKTPVLGVGETPGYSKPSDVETEQSSDPEDGELDEDAEEPEEEPEEVASEAAPVEVSALSRVMAAMGGDTVLRGLTAPCPTAAAVMETSFDAGASWVAQDLSASVPVVSLTRLVDIGGGFVGAVGFDPADCGRQTAAAAALGDGNWSNLDSDNFWKIDSTDSSVLTGPGGITAAPGCEIARFAATSDGALAVLCRDGVVGASVDSGATWVLDGGEFAASGGTPDSVAVGAGAVYVTAVGVPGCEGVSVASLSAAGLEPGVATCVAGVAGASGDAVGAAASGGTSLSYAPDGALWLWAGDALVRSLDGGGSWG